jgi:hypothetical protein
VRRRGATQREIAAALKEMNKRCEVPGTDEDMEGIAASVAKYPPGDAPRPKRDPDELSDLKIPDGILEKLANAGVTDDEIENAGSLADLTKLLGGAKETIATKAVKLALESGVELFHDDAGRPYATFEVDGHHETHSMTSGLFRIWLQRSFYTKYETAANAQALTDATGVLKAKAQFDGDELEVHMRIAGDALSIVVDLGDTEWNAIEITHTGWKVIPHPVKFLRSGAMRPLPHPAGGGSLNDLRELVNIGARDEDSWRLVVGCLLAAFRLGYPFPVLVVHGEHGAAKSSPCKLLRALIDPNKSPVRAQPRDDVDLLISASQSWVIAFDNISRLPQGLSDALCRLATGGVLSKRMLYTDADEVILDAMRPVAINGIDAVAKSSDLLDRALLVELEVIPKGRRISEEQRWARFAEIHAGVLGVLCDVLVAALRQIRAVELDELPRMADFARWVTAAESALGWEPGAFMVTYGANRDASHEVAVDASPIGPALLKVIEDENGFHGTSRELLDKLKAAAGFNRGKDWPTTSGLPAELKRLAPNLRALGWTFKDSGVGHGGARRWTIQRPL